MELLQTICWAVVAVLVVFALILLGKTAHIRKAKTGNLPSPKTEVLAGTRAVESLIDMIRIKTVSQPDELHLEIEWGHMRDYLRNRYPHVHQTFQREIVAAHSLLYRWPSDNPQGDPILLCAHMDVVPATEEGWKHPPFAGEIEDDRLYGRGALDCKGILVCLMEAFEQLCVSGYKPNRDIYIALGHDEELGGPMGARGMAQLFAARNLRFSVVLDECGWVYQDLFDINRPVAMVAVAEKGMAHITLTSHALGGHAAIPPADTAIGLMSEAVCRLTYRGRKPKITPILKEAMHELAPFMRFSQRFFWANRWLFPRFMTHRLLREPQCLHILSSTFAPVTTHAGIAHNVLPEDAEVLCNVRLLPGDTSEEILKYARDLTRDLGVTSKMTVFSEASAVSDTHGPSFGMLRRSIQAVFGPIPVVPWVSAFATDARHYSNFSDSVFRFVPFSVNADEVGLMHATNESIHTEWLGEAIAFYQDFVKRLTGGLE